MVGFCIKIVFMINVAINGYEINTLCYLRRKTYRMLDSAKWWVTCKKKRVTSSAGGWK